VGIGKHAQQTSELFRDWPLELAAFTLPPMTAQQAGLIDLQPIIYAPRIFMDERQFEILTDKTRHLLFALERSGELQPVDYAAIAARHAPEVVAEAEAILGDRCLGAPATESRRRWLDYLTSPGGEFPPGAGAEKEALVAQLATGQLLKDLGRDDVAALGSRWKGKMEADLLCAHDLFDVLTMLHIGESLGARIHDWAMYGPLYELVLARQAAGGARESTEIVPMPASDSEHATILRLRDAVQDGTRSWPAAPRCSAGASSVRGTRDTRRGRRIPRVRSGPAPTPVRSPPRRLLTSSPPPGVADREHDGAGGRTVVSRPHTHVGLITIKKEEFAAVLDRFAPDPGLRHRGRHRDYEVAEVDAEHGSCRVAITRCLLQGNTQALATAADLIDDLAPDYLIVVGIAGGVPTVDFTLGDVLVSSFIHDLTLEDTSTGQPRYNAAGGPLHAEAARIVAMLPSILRSSEPWSAAVEAVRPPYEGRPTTDNPRWNERIDAAFRHHAASKRSTPLVRAARIASSDRLIKDPDLILTWQSVIKDLVAVEMESAGVYTVCQQRGVPCLAIRGISDIVGWRRDERWTLYACETAAACTRGLVGSGVFSAHEL
jgi:nucleoside phosphorylase